MHHADLPSIAQSEDGFSANPIDENMYATFVPFSVFMWQLEIMSDGKYLNAIEMLSSQSGGNPEMNEEETLEQPTGKSFYYKVSNIISFMSGIFMKCFVMDCSLLHGADQNCFRSMME